MKCQHNNSSFMADWQNVHTHTHILVGAENFFLTVTTLCDYINSKHAMVGNSENSKKHKLKMSPVILPIPVSPIFSLLLILSLSPLSSTLLTYIPFHIFF